MGMVRALYQDPFSPVLFSSETLILSEEQKFYVNRILHTACSDTKFAEKAYAAIQFVLTGGSVSIPVVSSLSPSSAMLGSPSFTLHVVGTGFGVESVIVWNGGTELTTFVSDTELTTEIDMSTAQVAIDLPVSVQTGLGVMSNVMTFSLTDPADRTVKPETAKPGIKSEPPIKSSQIGESKGPSGEQKPSLENKSGR